jgi:hypothetical protein
MPEPFLTYRFQGFKFDFVMDRLFITNERHFPNYEQYEIIFTDGYIPFTISKVEEGKKDG